jgi:hypothetical protein
MSEFIAHKDNAGRWSVCNAETILVYNVNRQQALDAILAAGADANILVEPAPPNQWWPTLLAALQYSSFTLQATVNTLAPSSEVDALQGEVATLSELVQSVVNELSKGKQREALLAEIAEVEADIESRLPAVRRQLLGYEPNEHDIAYTGYTLDHVRNLMLRYSPIGIELVTLKKQLGDVA